MANKCDREDRVIETEKGKQLAEQHGLTFFETSAKSGKNVAEVFNHIARVIVQEKMAQQALDTKNGGGASTTTNSTRDEPIRMQQSA